MSTYTVRREWLRVRARDEEKLIGGSGSGFRKWEGRKTRRYGERSWSAYAVGWNWLQAKAKQRW